MSGVVPLGLPAGGALTAASGTIGRAIARCLALAGVPLVLPYQTNATRAAALVRELINGGARVHGVRPDFSEADAVREVVADAARRCGRLHTGVYCAGPGFPFLRVRDMAPKTIAHHPQADTLGCFRLFHHVIPLLEAGGGGSLTACRDHGESPRAEDPRPIGHSQSGNRVIDAASGGRGGCQRPPRECGRHRVAWGLRGQLCAGASVHSGDDWTAGAADLALMEWLLSSIRMRRSGRGQKVANIVAFLACEQASYATGCVVPADGGTIR